MPAPAPIYLDHAATTPLRPGARAAMLDGFAMWANPSSPHSAGRKARAALEDARERVRAALKWDGEVIFTSGASEAAERVLDYTDVLFKWSSAVEHDAINNFTAYHDLDTVPVGADGAVKLEPLNFRSLYAIQSINSETGNRQAIDAIADTVHGEKSFMLVDCAQSAGKELVPLGADFALIAAHKFGGPIGVGALLVKDFAMLKPSGGQERGYRRGTENLPGAMGMAAALEACSPPYFQAGVIDEVARLATEVRAAGGVWLSDRLSAPTPYIHAIAMPGLSGSAQLMRFDMAGIAVSQGSACSSGSIRRSHVLSAMGVEDELADRTIRMSIGWTTTVAEIERFAEVWLAMAAQAR